MPERPADQPDVNPARVAADPLLREIADMVAYMNLHIGPHQIKQMTTSQKELWADLADADQVLKAHEDQTYLNADGAISWEPRWWRPGHPLTAGSGHLPRSTNDLRYVMAEATPDPDPFLYEQEGGTRHPGPGRTFAPDRAAADVARAALLSTLTDPAHPDYPWRTEDLLAVYEWARASVRPLRMSVGQRAGQIGAMRAYPSLNEARDFLDFHRTERRQQHAT